MAEILAEDCCPSHGAWKPAPNAGFHISTATTATVPGLAGKANPAKIAGSVRFLHRTRKTKSPPRNTVFISLENSTNSSSPNSSPKRELTPASPAISIITNVRFLPLRLARAASSGSIWSVALRFSNWVSRLGERIDEREVLKSLVEHKFPDQCSAGQVQGALLT